MAANPAPLTDRFGRQITYLRVSVTDRCDLRCVYCMPRQMDFLPRRELLTLDELDRVTTAFIGRGVKRVRITGGEPLVRKDVITLLRTLSRHLETGALDELTLTTNGSQLLRHAAALTACGIRRINVSLDSLDPAKFGTITRGGNLGVVLRGIEAAERHAMRLKFNVVVLKGQNDSEVVDLVRFAHRRGAGISFIETMPLGEVGVDRQDQFVSNAAVRASIAERFTLEDTNHRTGGPARYVRLRETGGLVGFISPLSHNFCESCNRVRLSCTGALYTCLGQSHCVELREVLRNGGEADLHRAIDGAIDGKPKGHDFVIERARPALARHMNLTGG